MLGLIAAPGTGDVESDSDDTGLLQLSGREREILEHVARGWSNQRIAQHLFISPITVRNHVSHILTKLQLTDRREVMLRYSRPARPPS